MAYDAESAGARCGDCLLREMRTGGPVGPELHRDDTAALVAETPGEKECAAGRPLVGPGGMELTATLESIGVSRRSVALHHAVACMPPDGDLDRVMLRWQRENKKLVEAGEEPRPSPIECCRPRLLGELKHTDLVTLGKVALQSVTGKARPILDVRGGPMDGWLDDTGRFVEGARPVGVQGTPLRVLPTLHPGFVVRARRWSKAFKSDLSRAFRWFRGQLAWRDPSIIFNPSPMQLAGFLSRNLAAPIIFDLETTFDDPTVALIKCIGLSTETEAVVIHLRSIEGPNGALVAGPYTQRDEAAVLEILRDFFTSDRWLKAGHNAGYFDTLVLRAQLGITPKPQLDTILLHRSVESELPHKLGYIGSVYTDVTSWKDAHTAKTASTDHELGLYCAIDCAVTARALPQLAEAARLRGQEQVVQYDHRIQQVCAGLHETGMLVDRQRRDEEARRVVAEMNEWRRKTLDAAGRPTFNPNSGPQLRDLLFSDWKLTPAAFTKLGDPSTSDEALRLMRTQGSSNKQLVTFIDALRRYRRASKEYGTYIRRMVPYGTPLDGRAYQSEEEEEDAERGLIMADGRVRPDYNAHGTTSGRLSSSNPNAQNWPKHLRGMVIPQPGHVIVGADADQLELRIITAVARIAAYLKVFEDGGDPHAMTASLMFGKPFDNAEPKGEQWSKLRTIAKSIAYASFYGSGDETVHGLVTSAENENGELMYPDLTVREVATLRRRWLDGIPELPRWWDDTLDQYRAQGYILDPVWNRRRDFLDGEKFNEIVNFPIQSAGAHIIHMGTFDLVEEIPFGRWGPGTGLIAQVHDAVYVECPESEADYVAATIKKHMNRTVVGLDGVVFSAKPKAGKRWSDV